MSHSSLYLTNLYNDLITNTPQTITMDIPSEVGQGQISQTKIKHGVILSDWKMCYQSDMNVQGPVSGEYMQIIFCLNDGISWGIMNENRSITIQKNESCIYAGHDGTVMNIMLVSVTERTREIGIRKSLGAKGRDIRSQFIIEAGTTSAIGGVIGIILGVVLANVFTALVGVVMAGAEGFSAVPSAGGIAVSFGVSVGIGILFGYLPANKAAKLNPIDALRYD